ncbi:MAG: glycosyltransferase family 1 protein [Gemmataceae bacterium]|nr:glycosyltransferase family 1 protein [Gemmataceae bacterium]MDW8266579.1 glycosyltransferase family 1 protein [Gemmataceae bacterium]
MAGASRPIRTFTVLPHLPERLQGLQKLAYNMWWSWNHDAVMLFRRIDDDLFTEVENSPVKLLGQLSQRRLDELVADDGFRAHLDRVEAALNRYMSSPTWYQETYGDRKPIRIAYFSAEYGIHESIPIYSGGLGVLAGDHLKAASDLGIPLVGVGLMYREGYFRQYLNVDGWQQERYAENDFFNLPLIPETKADGSPLLVSVPFPGRDVWARIWRIQVGRVPLYLLDTNIPQNSPEDRAITGQLYGGDADMRIRQEMILGIGGVRALRALGKEPTVCHMNEGHSAFSGLERIRLLMEEHHLDFASAREAVTAGSCFTTHTPVPAGNDVFPPHLIDHYFSGYMHQLGIDRDEFLGLGRQNPRDHNEPFCMTVLAIRLANVTNGVSALHGKVSRKMWRNIWPDLPEAEVPITSITNGIHTRTWIAPEMSQLYERYLGVQWEERPSDHTIWKRVDHIPDAELWRTHERRRERLVAFARNRLKAQLRRRGAPPAEIARAEEVLDPEALTIGFARRFATYKRGTLIFRNLERLAAIINNKDRPVQFVFAGKAHPRDHGGKELIADILHVARRPEFRRRIVFIEDYDMNVARYLVQGVDLWLNNPRRPLEASGTSGMKVCCNGGINLSILDGWWVEAYALDSGCGWAIGAGEEYTDLHYQDDVESRAIYDLLEQEIVPLFYTRSSDGIPRGWLRVMKRSIGTNCPVFNTNRMVQEYTEKCYRPSAERYNLLAADNLAKARELAAWRRRLVQGWSQVRVEHVDANGADPMHVGSELEVTARVNIGPFRPDEVEVQLFHGAVDSFGDIPQPQAIPMSHNGDHEGSTWLYSGRIPCRASGQHGYAVRVLPKHPALANPFEPGLVCWG